jgi:hypothetical protein
MGNGTIHINIELQDDGSVKTKTHAEGIKVPAETDEQGIVAHLAWLYACAAAEAMHAGARHIAKVSSLDIAAALEIITYSTAEAFQTYSEGLLAADTTEVAQ